MSYTENTEAIENDYVKLWIEGGVIYGRYKPGVVIDLAAAQTIAKDRIQLSKGVDRPSLVYLTNLNSVTKEARDFFSQDDGIRYMKKLALLTDSPISKMVGNFWMQISKPTVPTRLFTTEKDALKWLNEDGV